MAMEQSGVDYSSLVWEAPPTVFWLSLTETAIAISGGVYFSGYGWACLLLQTSGSGCGDGLAILYLEKWKVVPVSVSPSSSLECLTCQISGPTLLVIATVYRPAKHHTEFLNEFSTLLSNLSTVSPNVILLYETTYMWTILLFPSPKTFFPYSSDMALAVFKLSHTY